MRAGPDARPALLSNRRSLSPRALRTPPPFFDSSRATCHELRRHRHRRRAQRPRERRLSRARRAQGARARAPARARRRGGHGRDLSRLQVLRLLLRRLAAAAGDHPRARSAAARPRDSAARRHVHADAGRRLSVARERSRDDAPRDRPALEARRRSVRRVRQGDGRDGPLRQADPRHDAARSDCRSIRAA